MCSRRVEFSEALPQVDRLLEGNPVLRQACLEQEAVVGAGSAIQRMREQRSLTQAELAMRAGTSQAYISQIERGLGPCGPTVSMLARLAEACGTHLRVSFDEPGKPDDGRADDPPSTSV